MSHTTLSDAVSPAADPSPGAGHIDSSPSPDEIMQLGLGFWGSKTLLSAVQLGLFSELAAAGWLDAEALRERLGLHPRSARDFFDALVALGMLERPTARYRNTDATELFLDRAKPSYVGGILEMANARLYDYWELADRRPAHRHAAERDQDRRRIFFDIVYADAAKLSGFLKAMTGISAGAAKAIATEFPWARYKTFIDIGCAEGCLPVAGRAGARAPRRRRVRSRSGRTVL